MLTIHKQALKDIGTLVIALPKGAAILCAHEQDGYPTIWYQCDTAQPLEERSVHVAGTGHEIPSDALYVGTCFCGQLVWHVFERAGFQMRTYVPIHTLPPTQERPH